MKYVFLAIFAILSVSNVHADWLLEDDGVQELLDDDDVFEFVKIGELVMVYRTSSLPKEEAAVFDLDKLCSVSNAVRNGSPEYIESVLIDQELSGSHRFDLDEAAALSMGKHGMLWRVKVSLMPTVGGFSGLPYLYRGLLQADGTPIPDEKAFVAHCDLEREGEGANDDDEDCDHLFSVIRFADFADPNPDEKLLHGDEILSRAETKLKSAIGKRPGFRFHDQRLVSVPILRRHDGNTVDRKLWKVGFIPAADDPDIEQPAIILWVTVDGRVSELSINKWSLKK